MMTQWGRVRGYGDGSLPWREGLFILALISGVLVATLAAQQTSAPNPCHVVVFKETQDSLYAELQAPRGTKRCVVEIK